VVIDYVIAYILSFIVQFRLIKFVKITSFLDFIRNDESPLILFFLNTGYPEKRYICCRAASSWLWSIKL
jgi:hypothetical protein